MNNELTEKMNRLEQKVERLNKERDKLLYSNRKLVDLIIKMDDFIEQNVRVGKLEKSQLKGQELVDTSDKLDMESVESQVAEINSMIQNLENH